MGFKAEDEITPIVTALGYVRMAKVQVTLAIDVLKKGGFEEITESTSEFINHHGEPVEMTGLKEVLEYIGHNETMLMDGLMYLQANQPKEER